MSRARAPISLSELSRQTHHSCKFVEEKGPHHEEAGREHLLRLLRLEVIIATYEPAGGVSTGSFALEEPTEAEIERRRTLEEG